MRVPFILSFLLAAIRLTGQNQYLSVNESVDTNFKWYPAVISVNPYKSLNKQSVNFIIAKYNGSTVSLLILIDSAKKEPIHSLDSLLDDFKNIQVNYLTFDIRVANHDLNFFLNLSKLKALLTTDNIAINSKHQLSTTDLVSDYHIKNVEIKSPEFTFLNDSLFFNKETEMVSIESQKVIFDSQFKKNSNIHGLVIETYTIKGNAQHVVFDSLKRLFTNNVVFDYFTKNKFSLNSVTDVTLYSQKGLRGITNIDFGSVPNLDYFDYTNNYKVRDRKLYMHNLPTVSELRLFSYYHKKVNLITDSGKINDFLVWHAKRIRLSCVDCDTIYISNMYIPSKFIFTTKKKILVNTLFVNSWDTSKRLKLKFNENVVVNNLCINYSQIFDSKNTARYLSRINFDTLTVIIHEPAMGYKDKLTNCPAMGKDMAYTEEECEKLNLLKKLLPGKTIQPVRY